jgi:hypothetical protein
MCSRKISMPCALGAPTLLAVLVGLLAELAQHAVVDDADAHLAERIRGKFIGTQ